MRSDAKVTGRAGGRNGGRKGKRLTPQDTEPQINYIHTSIHPYIRHLLQPRWPRETLLTSDATDATEATLSSSRGVDAQGLLGTLTSCRRNRQPPPPG